METIKAQVKNNMEILGLYKPQFDMTIDVYAGLIFQYKQLEKQFAQNQYSVEEATGSGTNTKKSPLVASMESLRKDILSYSNSLGLTPTALKRINDQMESSSQKKMNDLDRALSNFGL